MAWVVRGLKDHLAPNPLPWAGLLVYHPCLGKSLHLVDGCTPKPSCMVVEMALLLEINRAQAPSVMTN